MSVKLWLDLDGTLVDSRPALAAAFAAVLECTALGLPFDCGSELEPWLVRHPAELAAHLGVADLKSFVARFEAAFRDAAPLASSPPGVTDALSELAYLGVEMSVLTQQPHSRAMILLGSLPVPFAHVVTNEGLGVDKGLILSELRDTTSRGSRFIYVGDSVADVEASRVARFEAAAVAWGYTAVSELILAEPDYLFHHGSELVQLAAENGGH